jgi:hypothetical protein
MPDFIDGFDHYTDPTMKGWNLVGGAGDSPPLPTISLAAGRTGGGAMVWPDSEDSTAALLGLTEAKTMVVGFAFYFPDPPPSSEGDYQLNDQFLCDLLLTPDSGANFCNIALVILANDTGPALGQGALQFWQADYDLPGWVQTGPVSTEVFTPGWHYVEVGVTASNSGAGVLTVRVDGTVWLNMTSVTNYPKAAADFGSGAVQSIAFDAFLTWEDSDTGDTESFGGRIDDLYVNSNDTLTNPDSIILGVAPLGAAVLTVMPTADGSTVAFTRAGTDKGANFLQVNEIPPDDDTTYVSSSNPGDVDVYAVPPVSAPKIYSVAVNFCAEGPGQMGAVAKYFQNSENTNEIDSPGAQLIADSWNIFQSIFSVDPRTLEDWTAAGFAQDTFGVKITA